MRSISRIGLMLAIVIAMSIPAFAQNRGHGSIYYSPSGHRIGWARSLSNDNDANHVALAMCQGGQIDAQSLNAFSNKQGGVSATGTGPDLNVVLNDCRKMIKFDSSANHQCAGFGYTLDGRFSRGVRMRDANGVRNNLSSWPQAFVVCNDDASVSGFDRFVHALGNLATALGGNQQTSNTPVNPVGSSSTISFTNTANLAISFNLKCDTETTYHPFSIAPNTTQTFDSSTWGVSCTTYNVQLITSNSDGSQTQNQRTEPAGGPYAIVYNGDSYDIGAAVAPAALVVVNDTQQTVVFSVVCPNGTPTSLTVGVGTSTSNVLPCSQGALLTLQTGTNASSTTKIYPVSNGQTYHIHVDPTLQLLTLVHTQ